MIGRGTGHDLQARGMLPKRADAPAPAAPMPPALPGQQEVAAPRARLRDLARGEIAAPSIEMVDVKDTSGFPGMQRLMRIGLLAGAAFLVGGYVLGAQASIQGAVIASGILVVQGGPKAVQHPVGGVIDEVLVEDGDAVTPGQTLVRLDRQIAQAALLSVETRLANLSARLSRLIAERDGLDTLPPMQFTQFDMLSEEETMAILMNEDRQLRLREEARESKRAQLREEIAQVVASVEAREYRTAASEREQALVENELKGLRELYEKNLVPLGRLTALERDLSRLKTEQLNFSSDQARGRMQIAGLELQIAEVDQKTSATITDDISRARSEIVALVQERISAARQLSDMEIKAPQAGIVHELQVSAQGEVAGPGQVLMRIIPSDDRLVGEVAVQPADVDQLYPGQPVVITFSAFDRGTTPQVNGELASVSPDLIIDQRTGAGHYKVRLNVSEEELAVLKDLELVPGMPIESFIQTGERTLLSYVSKPIVDQFRRSLR